MGRSLDVRLGDGCLRGGGGDEDLYCQLRGFREKEQRLTLPATVLRATMKKQNVNMRDFIVSVDENNV